MLSWLDLLYLVLLLGSIPFGFLLNSLKNPTIKQYICLCAGVSITLFLNGITGSFHSFVTICGTHILSKLLIRSKYLPLISFVFVFGYLLFYRTCTIFGLPKPPKHSNAVQLLVTLRMISLSFQIHDETKKILKNHDTPRGNVTNNLTSYGGNSGSDTSNTNSSDYINNNQCIGLKPVVNDVEVTFVDFLAYGYSYIGLLTGPFYTYTTFKQMINRTTIANRCFVWPTINNLKMLPFLAVVYYTLKHFFPLHHLHDQIFLEKSSFFYCLYVITFTSMWFRWRFYIGWLLAQSSCISCGLGAYPVYTNPKPGAGPSTTGAVSNTMASETISKANTEVKQKPDYRRQEQNTTDGLAEYNANKNGVSSNKNDNKDGFAAFIIEHTKLGEAQDKDNVETANEEELWNFESIYNIDIIEVEMASSMKNIMRRWNMTVQWWMSDHVTKRLPFRNYYLKLVATLAISAFWHGIHTGYYLSFLSAVVMVFAQAGIDRCLPPTVVRGSVWYKWICWFFVFRYLDFIAIPFMLLQWDIVFKVWSRMWFYGHIMVFAFICIPLIVSVKKGNKNKKDML